MFHRRRSSDGEMLGPLRLPAAHPLTRASVTVLPPLPRPRPAELASRKPIDEAKPNAPAKPIAGAHSKPDKPVTASQT